jgi:hypothetical protein
MALLAGLILSASAGAGPSGLGADTLRSGPGTAAFVQKVDHRHSYDRWRYSDRHHYPYYRHHPHHRPYDRYYGPRYYAPRYYYGYDHPYYDDHYRHDDDDDELLWYGLGVMTPLLLESLYGY